MLRYPNGVGVMRFVPVAWASIVIVSLGVTAATAETCRVADPTGTPLNIRVAPNGSVIGTLTNGELVTVRQSIPGSGGRQWAYIERSGAPLGWVFRDYIACAYGDSSPQIVPTKSGDTSTISGATTIQMHFDAGTYVVPVVINNAITLEFVVDSGASDVTIPADVFLTLTRTGTITDADVIGKRKYTLADGTEKTLPTFRIRSLKVGNTTLENVLASVTDVKGSLLLGQSFLSRFDSWSIDNNKHQLVLNSCCRSPTVASPISTNSTIYSDSAPPRGPYPQARLIDLSRQFIFALYRQMSSPNETALAALNAIYDENVIYFGKSLTRTQVIEQEMNFLSRWPVRQYKPKDGSVIVVCDETAATCAASGLLQFDARSTERNERSVGEATFQYRLRFNSSGMPIVLVENGAVLKRVVMPLSATVDRAVGDH